MRVLRTVFFMYYFYLFMYYLYTFHIIFMLAKSLRSHIKVRNASFQFEILFKRSIHVLLKIFFNLKINRHYIELFKKKYRDFINFLL